MVLDILLFEKSKREQKKIIRIFSRIKVIAVPFDILEMDNPMEERTTLPSGD